MTAAPSLPPTWCRISRETKAARYRSLLAELITSDARMFLWGFGALGMTRVTVPVVGLPGENAFLTTPGTNPGYLAITPPDFRNEITTSWILGNLPPRLGTTSDPGVFNF